MGKVIGVVETNRTSTVGREETEATGKGDVWRKRRGRRANKALVGEGRREQYIGSKLKEMGVWQLQVPNRLSKLYTEDSHLGLPVRACWYPCQNSFSEVVGT